MAALLVQDVLPGNPHLKLALREPPQTGSISFHSRVAHFLLVHQCSRSSYSMARCGPVSIHHKLCCNITTSDPECACQHYPHLPTLVAQPMRVMDAPGYLVYQKQKRVCLQGRVSPAWESIDIKWQLFLMMCSTHSVTAYEVSFARCIFQLACNNGPLQFVCMTQPSNFCMLQLPIYIPSDEEKKDASLYSQNVRQYMVWFNSCCVTIMFKYCGLEAPDAVHMMSHTGC